MAVVQSIRPCKRVCSVATLLNRFEVVACVIVQFHHAPRVGLVWGRRTVYPAFFNYSIRSAGPFSLTNAGSIHPACCVREIELNLYFLKVFVNGAPIVRVGGD